MKKLNIDFDELQKAMEDTEREAFDYFLDRETGEIVILSEDILSRARGLLAEEFDEDMDNYDEVEFDEVVEIPEWMEDEIELALDILVSEKERYERIPERKARSGFAAMRQFTEQLKDAELKTRLLEILDGQGAFRRFKDALENYPKERKLWYGFNAKATKDEIRGWLHSLSIEEA